MEFNDIICLIIYGLALVVQAINLAGAGQYYMAQKNTDTLVVTSPTAVEKVVGFVAYILAASAISCLLYIYLLISKVTGKSLSQFVDWVCHFLATILQFAVATAFAIQVTNTKVAYQKFYDLWQPLTKTGVISDIYNQTVSAHGLSIAALVLGYIVCFAGGVFIAAKKELKNAESGTIVPKDGNSTTQINH